MSLVRLVDGDERQIPKGVRDVNGHIVDISGTVWRLNSPIRRHIVNWESLDDSNAMTALKIHLARMIETSSPAHCFNTFQSVAGFLKWHASSDLESGNTDLASLISYLECLRKTSNENQFHHIRLWYRASADRLIEGFDDEVVFALNDLRIPGNNKGFAVLSADPEEGPLSEFEEAALRRALIRDDGPIQQRAALWLALAFGTNPANLSLLREDDFQEFEFSDGVAPAYFLNMPRIKKRMTPRADFKKRYVDVQLAAVIKELIAYNSTLSKSGERPLFRREVPRKSLIGGPLVDYADHFSASEITDLIATCVQRLDVESPRTGEPIRITTRRLRYSFATRMVRQGIPERELADLLDHTDTQNVQVYYKADSRFVERLDATIAENLGPKIRAFMGEIKPRGSTLVDLIPFRNLPELGYCGASFSCGLAPHKSCYTCTKFNAFPDGAHKDVLEALLEERKDYLESGFERIAEQLDETILAVGEVVSKVKSTT